MDATHDKASDMLQSLGISCEEIVETIVTTLGIDRLADAAPMGLTRAGPDEVIMRPFVETQTYKNIRQTGKAVANIVGRAKSFMTTAFKLEQSMSNLIEEDPGLAFPVMKDADALIQLFLIRELGIHEGRASILLRVGKISVRKPYPRALSRSYSAAVEAIIHATRIQALSKDLGRNNVRELLIRFQHSKWIVENTSSPGSENRGIVDQLEMMIAKWLKKSE